MLPNECALELLPNPNPPALAAAVPSPNTLLAEELIGDRKLGTPPNAGDPPKDGPPPKAGGLPNTGAAPKLPAGFGGLEKEPNPCAATLDPALNEPGDF